MIEEMGRTKKVLVPQITADDAEKAMADYVAADESLTKMNAQIEEQCARIREKYAAKIANAESARITAFDTLSTYAQINREEVFGTQKSVQLLHGTIGFRTSRAHLEPGKDQTWDTILPSVRTLMPAYIRTKEEVDKARLLADRSRSVETSRGLLPMADAFELCGIELKQNEVFYVDTKKKKGTV